MIRTYLGNAVCLEKVGNPMVSEGGDVVESPLKVCKRNEVFDPVE